MAKFPLPDGSVLEVPDNLPQENKDRVVEYLQAKYPELYGTGRTLGGRASEFGKGIVSGLGTGVTSALEGISLLLGAEEQADYFKGLSDYIREDSAVRTDLRYADTYTTMLGSGLGSFASFFIPGTAAAKIAGAAGLGAKGVQAASIFGAAPVAVGSGVSQSERNLERAIELGEDVSDSDVVLSRLGGAVIGATELAPANMLFGRYFNGIPIETPIASAITQGIAEGSQEVLASVLQNSLSRSLYTDNAEDFAIFLPESSFDDFTVGAGVGAIADLAVRGFSGSPRKFGSAYERQQQGAIDQANDLKFKNLRQRREELIKNGGPFIDKISAQAQQEYTPDLFLESGGNLAPEYTVFEPLNLQPLQDGSANIVGLQTNKVYDTLPDVEQAAGRARELETQLRNEAVQSQSENIASINGYTGSGTLVKLLNNMYHPMGNQINMKSIVAFDSKLKPKKDEAPIQAGLRKAKSLFGVDSPLLTMQQAKRYLGAKDFDALMETRSQIRSRSAEVDFKREPLPREKDNKVSVSQQTFKNLLKAKNINTSLTSPEFEQVLQQVTGAKTFKDATRGQKLVMLSTLQRNPRFTTPINLPDLSPRAYSANQLDYFIEQIKQTGNKITKAEIKRTFPSLKPKDVNKFLEDLKGSRRIVNNQINQNFKVEQGLRASIFNETVSEFEQRLGTLPLTEEQVQAKVAEAELENKTVGPEALQKLPLKDLNEAYPKRLESFYQKFRQQMDNMGLKDVGLRFEESLTATSLIREAPDGSFYFSRNNEEGIYDEATKDILINISGIKPKATDQEIENYLGDIVNHEVIHPLIELGLLNDQEMKTLVAYAKKVLPKTPGYENTIEYLEKRYAPARANEEIIAELYRAYQRNQTKVAPKPENLLEKIQNFFVGTANSVFDTGFVDGAQLLRNIEAGRVGSRTRGEIRNVRSVARGEALYDSTDNIVDLIKDNFRPGGGFTINNITGEPITEGVAVAPLKEAEFVIERNEITRAKIFDFAKIMEAMGAATGLPYYVGGWYNNDTASPNFGKFVLDVTYIAPDMETALYVAEAGKQDGVFDIGTGDYVRTNEGINNLKRAGTYESSKRDESSRDSEQLRKAFEEARDQNNRRQEVRQASTKSLTQKELDQYRADREAIETKQQDKAPDSVSRFNTSPDVSDQAVSTAVRYSKGEMLDPDDQAVKARRKELGETTVESDLQPIFEKIGATTTTEQKSKTLFDRAKDLMGFGEETDNKSIIEGTASWWRRQIANKHSLLEKEFRKSDVESVRAREQYADTSAMARVLAVDKQQQLQQQVLTRGVPTFKYGFMTIENVDGKGGLIDRVFRPLNQAVEEYGIAANNYFKAYGIALRGKSLNDKGIETPVSDSDIKAIKDSVENKFPLVKEAYDNYQEFNNYLIDAGIESGIISNELTPADLRFRIKQRNELLRKAKQPQIKITNQMSFQELYEISLDNNIDTRPTGLMWKQDSNYYPFYKAMVEPDGSETVAGPRIGSGIIGGNPLALKLQGSEKEINVDPVDAVMRNVFTLMSAMAKNSAMQQITRNFEEMGYAREVTDPKDQKGIDVYPVYVEGQKKYMKVFDPILLESLRTLGVDEIGAVTRYLAMPAGFLRELVTREPTFIIRNLLRDTMSAAVTSGARFTPFVDTMTGFASDMSNLERAGIIAGYDAIKDDKDIKRFINTKIKGKDKFENIRTPVDFMTYIWDKAGEITYKSDGATRQAVYNTIYAQVLKDTGSTTTAEAEAMFQAQEIINYNRRGASQIVRSITAGVPFLNARIQGLDVLYRSATGKYSASKKRGADESIKAYQRRVFRGFLMRGGFLAFATAMYYMAMQDDEDYKRLSEEERDGFWNMFVGSGDDKRRLTIPIPFEVGILFKVVPERVMRLYNEEDEFSDTLQSAVRNARNTVGLQSLGFQAVKPFYEAMINNRSGFTGNEIVPYYMQALDPELQYNQRTSIAMREVGKLIGMSPMKLEYMLRGYTGTIGGYTLAIADSLTRQVTGEEGIPARLDQFPAFNAILRNPNTNGYLQDFYQIKRASDRYIQGYNKLVKDNRLDDLLLYEQSRGTLKASRDTVLAIDRYLADWRSRRDRILTSSLPPKEKQEAIKKLQLELDKRLAVVPSLRENIDVPANFVETVSTILR